MMERRDLAERLRRERADISAALSNLYAADATRIEALLDEITACLPPSGRPERKQPGEIKRKYLEFDPSDEQYAEMPVDELLSGSWPSAPLGAARLITSEIDDKSGRHAPVLDFDFPVAVVPSSTPGHFHVYLEREVPWVLYRRLLDVLAECGLLEPGYARASKARRFTAVRAPWVQKGGTGELTP